VQKQSDHTPLLWRKAREREKERDRTTFNPDKIATSRSCSFAGSRELDSRNRGPNANQPTYIAIFAKRVNVSRQYRPNVCRMETPPIAGASLDATLVNVTQARAKELVSEVFVPSTSRNAIIIVIWTIDARRASERKWARNESRVMCCVARRPSSFFQNSCYLCDRTHTRIYMHILRNIPTHIYTHTRARI